MGKLVKEKKSKKNKSASLEEAVDYISSVFYIDYSYRELKKNPILTTFVEKMDRLNLFLEQEEKKDEQVESKEKVKFEELAETVLNFKKNEVGLIYADRQTIIDYWGLKADFLKKLSPYKIRDKYLFNYYLELEIHHFWSRIEDTGYHFTLNHYHGYFAHDTLISEILTPQTFSKLASILHLDAKPTKHVISLITSMTLEQALDIPIVNLSVIFKYGKQGFFTSVGYYYKQLYHENKDNLSVYHQNYLKNIITRLDFIEKINNIHLNFPEIIEDKPFTEEMIDFLVEINKQKELFHILQSKFRQLCKKASKKAFLQRQFALNENNYRLIKHYLVLLDVKEIIEQSEKDSNYLNKLLDEYFTEAKQDFTNYYGQTRKEIVFAQLKNLYHYWQELLEKPDFIQNGLERINNALNKLEESKEIKELSLNRRLFLIYFFANDSFLFENPELKKFSFEEIKTNSRFNFFKNIWVNQVILPELFKNKWEDKNKTQSFYTFFMRNHIDKIIPFESCCKNMAKEIEYKSENKKMFFQHIEKEDIIAWFNSDIYSNYELTKQLFKVFDKLTKKFYNGFREDEELKTFLHKIDFLNLEQLNQQYLDDNNIKSFYGLTRKEKEYSDIVNAESAFFWYKKDQNVILENLDKVVELLVEHGIKGNNEDFYELKTFVHQHIFKVKKDRLISEFYKTCYDISKIDLKSIIETNQIARFQQIILDSPEYFLLSNIGKEIFKKEYLEDKDLTFIKNFLDKEKEVVYKICEFKCRHFEFFKETTILLNTAPEIPIKAIDFVVKKKTDPLTKENLFKRNVLQTFNNDE